MVKELTRERQTIKIQHLTKRKRVRIITVKNIHKKENLKNYITEHVSFLPVMLDEIGVYYNVSILHNPINNAQYKFKQLWRVGL